MADFEVARVFRAFINSFYFNKGKIYMKSRVQELAEKINMSCDDFVGEMRKRGCSEPTALKVWRGEYENFDNFKDNDINLSNLRKAAFVLKVATGTLLPR
ncbi:hypothetical protein HGA64_05815 [Candidatus Falkowbacteria bacterium]|nr:hypothetical protein [Candidatus Falkowbacteria bacterium]